MIGGGPGEALWVELTGGGSAHLDAELAARYFPGGALVARRHGDELWLTPLHAGTAGGLPLKQRNAAGDRAVLVRDAVDPDGTGTVPTGRYGAWWDGEQASLRVPLAGPAP